MLLKGVVKVSTERPKYEVADIFRRYMDEYRRKYKVSLQQLKAINAIMQCRTAALGGYIRQCDECGKYDIVYCSCKNRHCPKCGSFEKAQWLEKQKGLLLEVSYFQVVFTIDHVFIPLMWRNKKVMYDLMFRVTAKLLKEYGEKYLRGEIGFTGVLHTWGQTMQEHPHLHFIVAGGALEEGEGGAKWNEAKGDFLFPVVKLSRDFREAFCEGVKELYEAGELEWYGDDLGEVVEKAIRAGKSQRWEVYIQPPQKDPEKLLEYLGRYIYRIAISNYRIIKVAKGMVSFSYYDNRDEGKKKVMTLSGVEFIRRFLQHVLPHRFVRIRHYGLHHSSARRKLEQIRVMLGERKRAEVVELKMEEWIGRILKKDPNVCPHCGEGKMKAVRVFGRIAGWRVKVWKLLGIPRLGVVRS